MAIGGIGNGIGGTGGYSPQPARPDGAERTRTALTHDRNRVQATPSHAPEVDADGIPMEAPPGTDPALWSVLTSDERRYFAKLHTAGPLTYGPRTANVPPGLVRGGRIDRVV